MNRNKRVFEMAAGAVFLTIILLLTFLPIGYITLPFFPLVGGTLLHIPVLVAAIFFGKKMGVTTGLMFGISSWIYALIRAALPIEFTFQNPLVSVLPRVLFAYFTYLFYVLLSKRMNERASVALSAGLGTILHALLVVLMIIIFGQGRIEEVFGSVSLQNIWILIYTTLVFNTILETILAVLLVTPIVMALKSYTNKNELR